MKPPGRLSIGLAAAATTGLLALVGVGALTLPARVYDGAGGQAIAGVVESTTRAAPAPSGGLGDVAAESPGREVAAAAVDGGGIAPAAASLISATFAKLQTTPGPAPTAGGVRLSKGSLLPGGPTTHVVQTVAIRAPAPPAPAVPLASLAPPVTAAAAVAPDSAPVAPPAADAPVPLAPPAHLATADSPEKAAPAAQAKPSAKAKPAAKARQTARAEVPAMANGAVMKVGGQGVAVRSGPSTSKGRLFNLAAGQKVTITGQQRHWMQITDATGRRGWAYGKYLVKL